MIAENYSTANMPRFETVNVPRPLPYSLPAAAASATRRVSVAIWKSGLRSQSGGPA